MRGPGWEAENVRRAAAPPSPVRHVWSDRSSAYNNVFNKIYDIIIFHGLAALSAPGDSDSVATQTSNIRLIFTSFLVDQAVHQTDPPQVLSADSHSQ